MAVITDNSNTGSTNAPRNEKWKASHFLNVWLSNSAGKQKLVGVPLRPNVPREKKIIDFLSQGDEAQQAANLEKVRAKIVIDFQSADGAGGFDFDID